MKRMLSLVLATLFLFPMVIFGAIDASAASNATLQQTVSSLAQGQVPDLENIVQVADTYMNADISQTGITARIDENGRLNITQIVPGIQTCSSEMKTVELASSTFSIYDANGNEFTGSDYKQAYGSYSNGAVTAVHTAYYSLRQETYLSPIEAKVSRMCTSFSYTTSTVPSYLYHVMDAYNTLVQPNETDQSPTTISLNANQSYWFYPTCGWYDVTAVGKFLTYSYFRVAGTIQDPLITTVEFAISGWGDLL